MVGKNNQEIVSIKIEAELESLEHIKEIFNGIEKGNTVQCCDGNAELELLSAGDTLAFNGGVEVQFLLTFSVGVASGVIGNLIYGVICCGIKKLELNGRRTRITEENITQAIETIQEIMHLSEESKISEQNSNAQDRGNGSEKSDAQI